MKFLRTLSVGLAFSHDQRQSLSSTLFCLVSPFIVTSSEEKLIVCSFCCWVCLQCLLNETEIEIKTKLWMEENKEYLEKQKGEYEVEFENCLSKGSRISCCLNTIVPEEEVY